jgi:HK97 family phage prohead protease
MATHLAERRFVDVWEPRGLPVEVRQGARGSTRTIGGYAAVFNRPSRNLGGFVERIDPQAFNASRDAGWPGVMARFNHENEYLLGTTRSGTLRISLDSTGLLYDVDLPRSRDDVLELTERGDLSHSSFAFHATDDEWTLSTNGVPLRTVTGAALLDVAPVTSPAYPDATVGLRSLARHVGAPIEDVVQFAEWGELARFFRRSDGATPR